MHLKLLFIITLITVLFTGAPAQSSSESPILAFTDGHVWNGENFDRKTLFIQETQLIEGNLSEADSVVSLDGKYIIPPFGDAHTHNLGVGGYSLALARGLYLSKGIFYAMDLTNPYSEIKNIRSEFAKKSTVDVVFANGGITSTGSHPTGAMERIFTDKKEITLENLELEGDAYWFLDSLKDFESKWPKIMEQEPGILKIYMTYVEKGLQENKCYGLCPEVAEAVVAKAHDIGLRVICHINIASDVQYALDAGVDALAHLPSGNDGISIEDEEFWLNDDIIKAIGVRNMMITPTASLLIEDANPDTLKNEIERQRSQLRKLHEAGAKIALGADEWRETSLFEAQYFNKYDFFEDKMLLKLLTESTPRAIFPDRKIAKLVPGYEASFIVLNEDPLIDFSAIEEIVLGVKQGIVVIDN